MGPKVWVLQERWLHTVDRVVEHFREFFPTMMEVQAGHQHEGPVVVGNAEGWRRAALVVSFTL